MDNVILEAENLVRLTEYAHGGGCGCKLSPAVLRELLISQPAFAPAGNLLVGNDTSDDAAVWQMPDGTCMIATTDFFMPIVDDPRDFGRIAATNAISDVYAMGGTPIFALAILGMPLEKLPVSTVRTILAGGAEACNEAGIPVAGGHSIDTAEPIYGLAVMGTSGPAQLRRNVGAQPGDRLILTKPIGVGIYANALRKGLLNAVGYGEFLASVTQLNQVGADLGKNPAVTAMTDVTGFGLLGHALEMVRNTGTRLTIDFDSVPLLSRAMTFAEAGFVTGGSQRNWHAYGVEVELPPDLPETVRSLLTDPQTSGGLLVSCRPDAAAATLNAIRARGYASASIIGEFWRGEPGVNVRRHLAGKSA
jgi:selenide,water dikinase